MFAVKWIREIRDNTKYMDAGQRAVYIADYYWYHILLTFLAFAGLVLLIYNVTWGRQTVSLKVVIVNEQADDERDEQLAGDIAKSLGLEEKNILVDSNYQVNYNGDLSAQTPGSASYAGYDKFFFGWSNRELDAIVMPGSLLNYCVELGGELNTVSEDGGVSLALRDTSLAAQILDNSEDPMVVVFPKDSRNEEEAAEFLQMIAGMEEEG